MDNAHSDKVLHSLVNVFSEYRRSLNLTLEDLADRAGLHRTTVGLWERNERVPTVDNAVKLANAMGVELSALLAKAEALASGAKSVRASRRAVNMADFRNQADLVANIGITHEQLLKAFEGCYETLDTIDNELISQGSFPIAKLVELANLSSMIGNLVGAQIAVHSDGKYVRNKPHTYPDLLPLPPNDKQFEIKMALEKNSPKGHLAKPGTYMVVRYVLAGRTGAYTRGPTNRGDTAFVWETRVGVLTIDDFAISNTDGDSGKTAVIRTKSLDAMKVVYYVPGLLPYARARPSH